MCPPPKILFPYAGFKRCSPPKRYFGGGPFDRLSKKQLTETFDYRRTASSPAQSNFDHPPKNYYSSAPPVRWFVLKRGHINDRFPSPNGVSSSMT